MSDVARAFERFLKEMERRGMAPDPGDPAAAAHKAALLATVEAAWGQHLGTPFDTDQVTSLLAAGGPITPGGRLFPELGRLLAVFRGAAKTLYAMASWLTSPQEALDGETPAEWMRSRRDPERLLEAARRAAAAPER